MASMPARPRITSVHPLWAVEGGRITIEGSDLALIDDTLPGVSFGSHPARIVRASPRALTVLVPPDVEGGRTPIHVDGALGETPYVQIGERVAVGLHQVDSPAVDEDGHLYLTYSGGRGEEPPVSVFRVRADGLREPFLSGIPNATSMAFSPDGRLHVSSRFEGTVYRVEPDGSHAVLASDLGVACGLAFSPDGTLYVGDRSGTVMRIGRSGHAAAFASLPSSVAAFHLAWGPDDALYVSAPTLATRDSVYRIDHTGTVEAFCTTFGRPQGLAFDRHGALHVVEALAGASGVYRVDPDRSRRQVLSAGGLVGLAFAPSGCLVVASSTAAYRLDTGARC